VTTVNNKPDRPKKLTEFQRLQLHAREQTLRDLHGAFSVPDPQRNIHTPSEYLDDILKEVGAAGGVDEQQLRDVWDEVAGEFVAKNATPQSLRRGVLVLRVVQPAMKFHLEQMKGKLLSNLREKLGRDVVREVRFTIG